MSKVPTLLQELGHKGVYVSKGYFQDLENDILNEKTFQTFSKRGLTTLQKDLYTFQGEEIVLRSFLKHFLKKTL